MDKRIPTVFAIVVIAAWSVSFVVDLFSTEYVPPPTLHALMMALAGALLAVPLFKRNGNGNGKPG